jgi:hypothetical protein
MRFPKYFNVRLSPEMFQAVEHEARTRQQTLAAYCREALLADLKRSGVSVRPLRNNKQTTNKQTAEAA